MSQDEATLPADAAQRSSGPRQPPPGASTRAGGFAPPPGPLPRRYGPRPTVSMLRRAVLAVIVASGLLGPARNLLDVLDIDPLLALAGAVGLVVVGWALYGAARRWQSGRSDEPREVNASAVQFTHTGVRVYTGGFSSESFGWGEIAGLVHDGEDWLLEARPSHSPVRIRFPEGRDWTEDLLGALRDRPSPAPHPPAPED